MDNEAKTLLARYLDLAAATPDYRRRVLAAFDRLREDLPRRDDWFDVETIWLADTHEMRTSVERGDYMVNSWNGGLLVATVSPGWSVGWREIFGDEDVYNLLSWLLHYVQQYVTRSLILRPIMALLDERSVVAQPFTALSRFCRYGPTVPVIPKRQALTAAVEDAQREWPPTVPSENGEDLIIALPEQQGPIIAFSLSSPWLDRNLHDPFVHQLAFHSLRAYALAEADFTLESAVALGCILEVAKQFVRHHGLVDRGAAPSDAECLSALGLGEEMIELAEHLTFLRNHFGAHPGGWRWWDFDEMFAADLPDLSALGGSVTEAVSDLEQEHRLIEPSPQRWSDWLWESFEQLWRSVWFEAVASWNARRSRP